VEIVVERQEAAEARGARVRGVVVGGVDVFGAWDGRSARERAESWAETLAKNNAALGERTLADKAMTGLSYADGDDAVGPVAALVNWFSTGSGNMAMVAAEDGDGGAAAIVVSRDDLGEFERMREELAFGRSVDEGAAQAERGEFASDDEVEALLKVKRRLSSHPGARRA
jgi:hypothetical protein